MIAPAVASSPTTSAFGLRLGVPYAAGALAMTTGSFLTSGCSLTASEAILADVALWPIGCFALGESGQSQSAVSRQKVCLGLHMANL